MSNDNAKKAAGYMAADLVQSGMKVGLGTGSTAFFFIERLIERIKSENLKIEAIATSQKSTDQAKEGSIPIISDSELDYLDIDIDGADEIDLSKQMIKGGGGALFREKIIASCAKEMVVVVDESKVVQKLGKHPLPIEITPFCYPYVIKELGNLKLMGDLRKEGDKYYITDNHNYIYDVDISNYQGDLIMLDQKVKAIPGVIESGFFWNLAKRVIIGYNDGRAEIKDKL